MNLVAHPFAEYLGSVRQLRHVGYHSGMKAHPRPSSNWYYTTCMVKMRSDMQIVGLGCGESDLRNKDIHRISNFGVNATQAETPAQIGDGREEV